MGVPLFLFTTASDSLGCTLVTGLKRLGGDFFFFFWNPECTLESHEENKKVWQASTQVFKNLGDPDACIKWCV